MNRLVAGALVREALAGPKVLVLVGSPRAQSLLFELTAREAEKAIAGTEHAATVTPESSITIDDAGSIHFAVAGQPHTGAPSLVYADMASIGRALGGQEREIDMLLRPLEMSGAEVIRSEADG